MKFGVSVIIRTKNESRHLAKVLWRLKEQAYDGPVETIVVDSGSTDGTVSIAEGAGCRLVRIKPEDFSFGRALNVGIECASGQIMIHLSGHSVPERTNYFDLMAGPFSDPAVAATYGRDIPWPEACPSQARDILNHFPDGPLQRNKFSNANAAVRKTVWEMIRFDEEVPACEDLLWARSVMSYGYSILYVPKATVFHSHTSSLKYIFTRYVKERRAITETMEKGSEARGFDGGFRALWESYVWQVKADVRFVKQGGYSRKWFMHIPLYRLAQGLGLYVGTRMAERGRRHG